MTRRIWTVTILLAGLVLPPLAAAGGRGGLVVRGRFSGGAAAVAAGAFGGAALVFGAAAAERSPLWRDEPPLLIIDAAPHDAQVYLDGQRLGTAGELVALALPVTPGPHTVQVVAPGFRPAVGRFVADGTFPVRLRATLTRE